MSYSKQDTFKKERNVSRSFTQKKTLKHLKKDLKKSLSLNP